MGQLAVESKFLLMAIFDLHDSQFLAYMAANFGLILKPIFFNFQCLLEFNLRLKTWFSLIKELKTELKKSEEEFFNLFVPPQISWTGETFLILFCFLQLASFGKLR